MKTQFEFLSALARVSRGLQNAFDARLKDINLTSAKARVLHLLADYDDGVPQSDLTELMGVEHPTAVRILDGVEKLGLIQRLPSPDDRRAKIIVLTAEGRPLAQRVIAMVADMNKEIVNGLAAKDIAQAQLTLAVIAKNLGVPDGIALRLTKDEVAS